MKAQRRPLNIERRLKIRLKCIESSGLIRKLALPGSPGLRSGGSASLYGINRATGFPALPIRIPATRSTSFERFVLAS